MGRPTSAAVSVVGGITAVVGADGVAGVGLAEQRASQGHACRPTGVRQKPRLPDAHEAARQDVLDEATEKLHRRERHGAVLVAVGIVLPLEGDVVAIEREQPVIADRDPMGIAPEIAQDC